MTQATTTRWAVAALAMLIISGWLLVDPAAGEAEGQDTYTIADCTVSGAGIEGTTITIPVTRTFDWEVHIVRNGETLVFKGQSGSGHTLARDGEPYDILYLGDVVFSGVGKGFGCDEETTTTAADTTTTVADTTTTVPDETTTTTADVCQEDEPCWDCETMGNHICGTTTTIPGFPDSPTCPNDQVQIGTTDEGNAICEARVSSG